MKSIDEIIGRAENLLCIMDRCGLENSICDGKRYTKRQRNEQRLVIYKWLRDNDYIRFMTETEKYLFDKHVGNPFNRKVFHNKFFECEAIEPLLWTLGLTKRLSPYSRYVFTDWQVNNEMHLKLKVNVPNTHQQLLKKVVLQSEAQIELRDEIAMLWHWRAIEGKNPIFKTESVSDILIDTFGDIYGEAIDNILKGQKNKQDFAINEKYVYQLSSVELQHLYKRTKWRYHAFEWVLMEEDWDDVKLNT